MAFTPVHLTSYRFLLAALLTGFFALTVPACAEDVSVTDAERAKIESVVKDYLIKNPGIIMESLRKQQDQQRVDESRLFSEKFASEKEKILKAGHPIMGSASADVTIIEFYDYNCGYCKKAYEDVDKLIAEDKKLRFVFIEMPILSETSIEAAKWALAANKQGKFYEFHSALMKYKGAKDKKNLERIAGEVKLDIKKAAIDSESKETLEMLEGNLKLARDLGINGTPGFIFNDQMTPGYMGYEGMKEMISSLRSAKTPGNAEKN